MRNGGPAGRGDLDESLYVRGQKRVQRNYSQSGMAEIWNVSRAEANQLSSL
jgi:hypothetical protein